MSRPGGRHRARRPRDHLLYGRSGIRGPASVSDTLREWSHLYRRLGLILEQLAAHGRTAIVKGCARPSRGWRRSPLGGAHGSQYYLCWEIAGSSGPADSCGAEPRTIVVRAVRHHDDHTPLGGGSRNVGELEDPPNIGVPPTARCCGAAGIVRRTACACAHRRQGASLRSAPASRGFRP